MHHEARGNEPHLYAVFWRRDQPIATRRSTRPAAVDASSLPPSVLYLRIQSAPVPRRRVADSPNATATPTPPAAGLTGRCHATLRPGGCVRPGRAHAHRKIILGSRGQVRNSYSSRGLPRWQRLAKTGCGRWCRATPLKGDALAGEPGAGKGHCPSGRGGRGLPGRAREVQVAATRRSY